ncbi:putative amidohydrolase [Nocardioides luteus]|uniref:Hydrolase n=1 Tax=Nocardioides luteus TaxID=1844 RepID=A0ABQ5SZ54_9ACTN|nr:carbon-nitrogen hydrolase family protein [Nocardioides luteus]MDR7312872.1 putative amidohydrolase [Nocardioides luteus]GGR48173.1 hydrolase [Nocardioides luteus]GLJ69126.1 hydrolase [Nocardioides luteus]
MTTWNSLRISLVQQASGLEPDANRSLLAELTPDDSDLVVFPEVFSRDFGKPGSDLGPYAEEVDGPFGAEVARVAKERGTTVVAGMLETSGDPEGRPFNTLLVRGGAEAAYRKIHLYDSFGYKESDALLAGEIEPKVIDIGGVPTGLMTCYDLRFPELARRLVDEGAELIVLPAAWVAGPRKVDHWRTLVRARAIENTVFIAAAAQPTPRYCGHSMVVDPLGDVLVEAGDDDQVVSATIERGVLEEARRTNPSLVNRRM